MNSWLLYTCCLWQRGLLESRMGIITSTIPCLCRGSKPLWREGADVEGVHAVIVNTDGDGDPTDKCLDGGVNMNGWWSLLDDMYGMVFLQYG